jgi:hypothetical protein
MLVDEIVKDYESLELRIAVQVETQKALERKDLEEKRARVEAYRKEREAESQRTSGQDAGEASDGNRHERLPSSNQILPGHVEMETVKSRPKSGGAKSSGTTGSEEEEVTCFLHFSFLLSPPPKSCSCTNGFSEERLLLTDSPFTSIVSLLTAGSGGGLLEGGCAGLGKG